MKENVWDKFSRTQKKKTLQEDVEDKYGEKQFWISRIVALKAKYKKEFDTAKEIEDAKKAEEETKNPKKKDESDEKDAKNGKNLEKEEKKDAEKDAQSKDEEKSSIYLGFLSLFFRFRRRRVR